MASATSASASARGFPTSKICMAAKESPPEVRKWSVTLTGETWSMSSQISIKADSVSLRYRPAVAPSASDRDAAASRRTVL